MMKQNHRKLLTKNICWRMLLSGFFLLIGNLPLLIKPQNNQLSITIWFNMIMSLVLIAINVLDICMMIFLKKSFNKFTKWLFINKFFSWQTVKGAKHLATTKQNRFLVKSKNFWSMPLWSPLIEIPIGIFIFLAPLLILGITTIFNDSYLQINSLMFYGSIVSLLIVISNIWLKNCNDGFKNHNKNCEMIQDAIEQIDITNYKIHKTQEIWTSGLWKVMIMMISSAFLILSIIGFLMASLTLFANQPAPEIVYPYFKEWRLFIFKTGPWQNALMIALMAWLLLVWFVNIWVFITTPWSLLVMWKMSYLTCNLISLNLIVILFWTIRFDDEEKMALLNDEKIISKDEIKENTYATTSSIIEQVNNNQEIEIHDEQIITRIVPLDQFDENK